MKNQNRQMSGTRRDVAERYGIAEGTLSNLAWRKEGPKYFRRGRRCIYFFEDVENWLRQNPVQTLDSVECG